jgi:hypothetical protein
MDVSIVSTQRAALLCLMMGSLCFAQKPATDEGITVQGSYRSRVEMWDWFEAASGESSYAYSGNVLRLSIGQQRERIDWQIELAAPVLLGLPSDAVAPGAQGQLGLGGSYYVANDRHRNAAMVFPKQAFVRVKQGAHALRLGRFEFIDGAEIIAKDPSLAWVKRERVAQRLIGPFGWSHVGRSYDGAHYTWTRGQTNFTLMAALPTRGAFQVDGWGNLKTAAGYAALSRLYSSAQINGDYRVFGIYYHDWRHVLKTDNRPLAARQRDLANIRVGSFGGHALHTITTAAGTVDTMLWGLGQHGKWGLLDHSAGAYAVEAGWQPRVRYLKPWLRAGWSHTTGDGDPLDNEHGSFLQILPTPRPYARFPFHNMMNNQDLFAMVLLRPHSKLTLRSEAHSLRLSERNDLWYVGGGAFQPWTFGYVGRASNGNRGLTTSCDVSAEYNANARATVTGYFGHARGRSVISSIYPRGANGSFGYLELLIRF